MQTEAPVHGVGVVFILKPSPPQGAMRLFGCSSPKTGVMFPWLLLGWIFIPQLLYMSVRNNNVSLPSRCRRNKSIRTKSMLAFSAFKGITAGSRICQWVWGGVLGQVEFQAQFRWGHFSGFNPALGQG